MLLAGDFWTPECQAVLEILTVSAFDWLWRLQSSFLQAPWSYKMQEMLSRQTGTSDFLLLLKREFQLLRSNLKTTESQYLHKRPSVKRVCLPSAVISHPLICVDFLVEQCTDMTRRNMKWGHSVPECLGEVNVFVTQSLRSVLSGLKGVNNTVFEKVFWWLRRWQGHCLQAA